MGYIVILRPTLQNREGVVKGNCDAELVLHGMIQYPNFSKAITTLLFFENSDHISSSSQILNTVWNKKRGREWIRTMPFTICSTIVMQ